LAGVATNVSRTENNFKTVQYDRIVHIVIRAMADPEEVNILIVDDKEYNVFALEQMLAKKNRIFHCALTGEEALKILLNREIDLIILDVQMPDMDGFEVAQILKSTNRTMYIPIIFASAEKREQHFMLKGIEEGAIDYLYKPLDPDLTEAKVSVLLNLQLQKKKLIASKARLEKYGLLINNSADIIGIVNPLTLQFEEINQTVTSLLGYSAEEVKGTSLTLYLPEEYHEQVDLLRHNPAAHLTLETQLYSKWGTVRWFQWSIVQKDGLWFVNARDITDHKRAEREIKQLNADLHRHVVQLESTNKELESFSYSVSHDLRAPLRAINGFAHILGAEYGPEMDGEMNRLLQIIQHNAKKMGGLIDDLLAFSQLGRKEVVKTHVDMNALVRQILSEQANHRQARVQVQDLPAVEGDYTLLYQVFVNLISNAFKYSSKRDEPQIEIGGCGKGEDYVYFVKDNGTGFDMDYVHKLFGVFQRLHTDEEFEGTGVGLAIVHRIVSKHGGQVWAESKPGLGATFFVALPKPQSD
jgi:PAS domain S-box-containing protein